MIALAIAGFDTEAIPVGLEHPVSGFRLYAPEDIDQGLPSPALCPPAPGAIATMDTEPDMGLAVFGTGDRVVRPTAALWQRKDARATGSFGVASFATADNHRQDKRIAGRPPVADDRHPIEAAIEQPQLGTAVPNIILLNTLIYITIY